MYEKCIKVKSESFWLVSKCLHIAVYFRVQTEMYGIDVCWKCGDQLVDKQFVVELEQNET